MSPHHQRDKYLNFRAFIMCLQPTAWSHPLIFSLLHVMSCNTKLPTGSWETLPCFLKLSFLHTCCFPLPFLGHLENSTFILWFQLLNFFPWSLPRHPPSPPPADLAHHFKHPLHWVGDHKVIILLLGLCYLYVLPLFTFSRPKVVFYFLFCILKSEYTARVQ